MSVYKIDGDLGSDAKIVIAREIELKKERHLEQLFENSPIGLNQNELILWIGKQKRAQNEDNTIIPDLLGIDSEGYLVIVEFKRGRTPRDVIAQLFEYAAWASELSETQIINIAEAYFLDRDRKVLKFHDRFQDVFGIPDISGIPTLNRSLRLFIVAEEISDEIVHVCRWQRSSLGLDITCIEVTLFQTDSNEMYVDMEVKVGEEDIDASYLKSTKRGPKGKKKHFGKPAKEIVWEAVQQLTGGDESVEWTLKEMRQIISEKYEGFNRTTADCSVYSECVNHNSRHHYPGGQDRYWQIKVGVYKLYNPLTDKEEFENTVNTIKCVDENGEMQDEKKEETPK